MTNQERIALLEEYKLKERFILDEWEDREVAWPGDDVVEQMKLEVLDFTNFLIIQLKKEDKNLQNAAQNYFKDWDTEYFENEEIEFIVEVEFEAMRHAGLNIEELIIWKVRVFQFKSIGSHETWAVIDGEKGWYWVWKAPLRLLFVLVKDVDQIR